jgi:DNA topoisomerase-1
MAASAVDEIREYIGHRYGKEYLPASARHFTKKVKLAQEAHEAIRPTKAGREPDLIKDYLNKDQLRLYELIWKRAVASQMSAAVYDTITVDIEAASGRKTTVSYIFQTKASKIRFPGFMTLYIEGHDEEKDEFENGKPSVLPALKEGERLQLIELFPEQFFTQPPARYTEATLIKALEQKGIGRPSTYAPIISTIQDREYVYKEDGRLKPEEIGMLVNDLLVGSFPNIVDFNFTANMENELDEIARGAVERHSVITSFYSPFEADLSRAMETLQKVIITSEEMCPLCGKPLVLKSSKYGKFLACSNYPECKGKKSNVSETKPELSDEPCPECGKMMLIRKSRFGKFLACPDYPACKGKKNMARKTAGIVDKADGKHTLPETTDEKCPKCGAPMVIRAGRFGKFLACSTFPKCKTTRKILADKK